MKHVEGMEIMQSIVLVLSGRESYFTPSSIVQYEKKDVIYRQIISFRCLLLK